MKDREEDAIANARPTASTLDKLIDSLKGPKAISTVSKSSADWEIYKEKEGITDEQLTAAKDGYLAKQEFLQQCDVVNYENEKEVRMSNQQKR